MLPRVECSIDEIMRDFANGGIPESHVRRKAWFGRRLSVGPAILSLINSFD